MKKKILYSMMFFYSLILILPSLALSAPDLTVMVSDSQVNIGDQVDVMLDFENNGNVVGIDLNLQFNSNVLSFVEGSNQGGALTTQSVAVSDQGGGVLRVLVNPPTVQPPLPLIPNGEVVMLQFNAIANGTSNLTLPNIALSDTDGVLVTPDQITNGSVTVGNTNPDPDPDPDPDFPDPDEPGTNNNGGGGGCYLANSNNNNALANMSFFLMLMVGIGSMIMVNRLRKIR